MIAFTGKLLRILVAATVLILLSGCSEEQTSAEQQIRDMINRGEQAAEARSVRKIMDLITDPYKDARGRTRQDMMRIAAAYFLRNKSIHLLTQIERIDLLNEQKARVVLFVAMAASPLEGAGQLLNIRADLHRFDLEVVLQEDEWRVSSAVWKRATHTDFR